MKAKAAGKYLIILMFTVLSWTRTFRMAPQDLDGKYNTKLQDSPFPQEIQTKTLSILKPFVEIHFPRSTWVVEPLHGQNFA